ncbi:MAG: hypothetical protein WBI55_03370 [Eubacteriales bacterium]|jgi:hypothetical protein|nr:hypothetical protein [Clostridiales bacterium]
MNSKKVVISLITISLILLLLFFTAACAKYNNKETDSDTSEPITETVDENNVSDSKDAEDTLLSGEDADKYISMVRNIPYPSSVKYETEISISDTKADTVLYEGEGVFTIKGSDNAADMYLLKTSNDETVREWYVVGNTFYSVTDDGGVKVDLTDDEQKKARENLIAENTVITDLDKFDTIEVIRRAPDTYIVVASDADQDIIDAFDDYIYDTVAQNYDFETYDIIQYLHAIYMDKAGTIKEMTLSVTVRITLDNVSEKDSVTYLWYLYTVKPSGFDGKIEAPATDNFTSGEYSDFFSD